MIEKVYKTSCGEIHYWISEDFKSDEATLVFLPGLTADHRLFEKQTEYFESKYNVLVWDAPAHASSWPFHMNFTLMDKANWLDQILAYENVLHPVFIGQSMGGYVSQMYMEMFPRKVKGFVSIDSCPLQRKYMTWLEVKLLKIMEPVYRWYSWKKLLKAGSAKRYNKAWHKKTGIPMEWIKGAGHNSNTDAPEIVNGLIRKFVDGLQLGSREKDQFETKVTRKFEAI